MYAIVETGGHQVRVAPGSYIDVDRLTAEPGTELTLDRVLMLADGEAVTVGQPVVPGAKVMATVVTELKGPKIVVFKYKPKVRYRRRQGHRQRYTRLRIDSILEG